MHLSLIHISEASEARKLAVLIKGYLQSMKSNIREIIRYIDDTTLEKSNVIPCAREEAVIVGDSLSSDILGGINAGVATCWYNPKKNENSGKIKPDYEICHLKQLKDIL